MEKVKTKEVVQSKLQLPQIRIENRGCITKLYVDGEELPGVMSIGFLHDRRRNDLPTLRVELLAERICIDTTEVFELPEVYRPYYVSADQLVYLGILKRDQLNDLLEKKLL